MNLFSNGQGSGKNPNSSFIMNLPDDCQNLIFKCLGKNRDDSNSFGLTCRQWLHIQNNNCHILLYDERYNPKNIASFEVDESYTIVLGKLLSRFPNLKCLFLAVDLPEVTEFLTSKPPLVESKVQRLFLDNFDKNSHTEPSPVFFWFPRLKAIDLSSSYITDKGLEVLAKCCSSLKIVNLSGRRTITDTGISFLIQNCRKLRSLNVGSCSNITGIGFLGCPKTLIYVSGGGLEYLILCDFPGVGEGSINTEAVVTISKGCPSLKNLELVNCKDVELEGWEAIGLNCRNLEYLKVYGCRKLCDLGLQSLREGCSKLSRLLVNDANSCSSSAIEIFKRKRPNVMCHF